MGASNQSAALLSEYNIQQSNNSRTILSKKQNQKEKYIMKTYVTNIRDEHEQKMAFFNKYKANMEDNLQILKLVNIIQEKQEHLCSTYYKLHLVFQYSLQNIYKEMNSRRKKQKEKGKNSICSIKYFSYVDICNILYSCLSCLWLTKEQSREAHRDTDLSHFGTIFISTQNILLFGEGIIKITDPFMVDFQSRYTVKKNVYYSPQKMANFYMIDDEKCAIFQLGMTILSLSLLEPLNSAYQEDQIVEEVISKKLQKVRQIYSNDLKSTLSVSVFDLIEKMIECDRQKRFNLQQAIGYAEQMYQVQESFTQQISQSNKSKFYTNEKKQTLNNTAHSTNNVKLEADSHLCDDLNKTNDNKWVLISPKISRFTINEVDPQKQQQSSYIQSLMVENMLKSQYINKSLVHDGIFSGLNIGDSYSYCSKYNFIFPTSNCLKKEDDERIFTDPQLLKTINQSLQKIESRRRQKTHKELLASSILQQKNRYNCENEYYSYLCPKFTNKVYLSQQY